jgi:NAD(P)-dependent dehydrogenase (short-subunit alcohol dehydrogenase family)
MDLGLTNATAVVVGGGRGMGLAAARCLADDGARVAILARSRVDLDRAAADLTDRGSPDALGLDLTDEQWRQAFDDGVMGMVRCVRSALPLLRKAAWARIVNFSAHSTQRQSVMLPAYTAAKAALTSISKNLSLLLAKDEILVNVVSPGSIASESLVGWAKSVGVDGDDPYQLMDAIAKHFGHPAHLPRAGLLDEMGSVVAFLASRRNSYMTGANINVDGGSDFT